MLQPPVVGLLLGRRLAGFAFGCKRLQQTFPQSRILINRLLLICGSLYSMPDELVCVARTTRNEIPVTRFKRPLRTGTRLI